MKKILFFGSLLILASACTNFLDPYPNADRNGDQIWNYSQNVQGMVQNAYDYVNANNRNYLDFEGTYLDGATDDAVMTSTTHRMSKITQNTLLPTDDGNLFQPFWDRNYKGIYLVNLFLKDRRGINSRLLIKDYDNRLLTRRLQGEAYALRAWFYWDLLQKFGGKGINGELLGVPLLTEPSDVTADNNLSRASYDDCVAQIIKDCDSAWVYLPLAHRDQLTASADQGYLGGRNWGRFDGISTKAIKALVYLTWASPRFNPTDDVARWDSAAVNAKAVIDFKHNYDFGYASVTANKGVFYTDPNSPELVMVTRYNTNNGDLEVQFMPGGYNGKGSVGPTQDLVDAFPDNTGYPITDGSTTYVATTPYLNRDNRFYATIFYNTSTFKLNNTGATYYTFNTVQGGTDASGPSTNTRTNYYIKKFCSLGYNLKATSPTKPARCKFLIRYAHMLLAFAEAANHVVGPTNTSEYGMSAQDALRILRYRKTNFDYYNGLGGATPPATPDAYLALQTTESAFDALLKNERRIETCFEGIRFWDLRRWSTDLTEINKPAHMVTITGTGPFTYDFTQVVETRNFTSAYWPIPYQEMLRMSNMVQNEGWPSWN